MKHEVNLHGIWKFESESHCVDLFHDYERTKILIVQFFGQPSCFDVLSSKPNLISNIWLVFMMFINIFLILLMNFLKVGYKLCSNVC
jgi:hypothetical protein